ncbi:MAG TPA: regulatory protein RecX [Firmicutes bacterium]|nr:regulatory protein RecX [Bacillota bacterium]
MKSRVFPSNDTLAGRNGSEGRDWVSKGVDRALRLLEKRPRTKHEIRMKLFNAGCPQDAIVRVLERLEQLGYIDDVRFARDWAQERAELKGLGKRRVRFELLSKGIASELADQAIYDVFSTIDEDDMARRVAERRLPCYRDLDPVTKRRRLVLYLARRGFDFSTAERVVQELVPL